MDKKCSEHDFEELPSHTDRRFDDLVIAVFFGGPLLILFLVTIAFVLGLSRWFGLADVALLTILAVVVTLLSVGIATLLRARGRQSKGWVWICAATGLLVLPLLVMWMSVPARAAGSGWYVSTTDLLLRFSLAAIPLAAGIVKLVLHPGRAWPAWAWLGIGVVMLALCVPASVKWLHVPERQAARDRRYCLSNLKKMALTQLMYTIDFGRLPPAENWPESTAPYWLSPKALLCSADHNRERQTSGHIETSYTMNELLGGQRSLEHPRYTWYFRNMDVTPLLFDGTELCGTHEAADFRHAEMGLRWTKPKSTGLNVVYADGHAEYLTSEQFRHVRMEP